MVNWKWFGKKLSLSECGILFQYVFKGFKRTATIHKNSCCAFRDSKRILDDFKLRPRRKYLCNSSCKVSTTETSMFSRYQLYYNRETVFSTRYVPRCYKHASQ